MPTSCVLFGGFAIGSRVSLLWQHSASAKCQRVLVLAPCLVVFANMAKFQEVRRTSSLLLYVSVSLVGRSASRAKHAGACLSAARTDGSNRLSGRVQPAAHGRRLVQGGPDARLSDGPARQSQQIRHAHLAACDIVRRGPVFVYAVLAAWCRSLVRSRPCLRPRSVQETHHSADEIANVNFFLRRHLQPLLRSAPRKLPNSVK